MYKYNTTYFRFPLFFFSLSHSASYFGALFQHLTTKHRIQPTKQSLPKVYLIVLLLFLLLTEFCYFFVVCLKHSTWRLLSFLFGICSICEEHTATFCPFRCLGFQSFHPIQCCCCRCIRFVFSLYASTISGCKKIYCYLNFILFIWMGRMGTRERVSRKMETDTEPTICSKSKIVRRPNGTFEITKCTKYISNVEEGYVAIYSI